MIAFVGTYGWFQSDDGHWSCVDVKRGQYILVKRTSTEAGLSFVEVQDLDTQRVVMVDGRDIIEASNMGGMA